MWLANFLKIRHSEWHYLVFLSFGVLVLWLNLIICNALSFAEASIKKDACTHPGSFREMCILCGQRLDDKFGVTFGYIQKV